MTEVAVVQCTKRYKGVPLSDHLLWTPIHTAVAKVLDTADPVTKVALNSFYKLHDSLVVGDSQ
jgi:hypothetical protein